MTAGTWRTTFGQKPGLLGILAWHKSKPAKTLAGVSFDGRQFGKEKVR
jgi:hypothetical protein